MKHLTCLLSTVLTFIPSVVMSSEETYIPSLQELTVEEQVIDDGQVVGVVKLPDWERIGFENFPPVGVEGSIGDEFNQYVDYDLSRSWQAGERIEKIMKLGDIEEGLSPQAFSLEEIESLSEVSFDDLTLEDFPLIGEQTIASLVESHPALENLRVSQVPPIADLLGQEFGFDYDNYPLGNLVDSNSRLADLRLDLIDLSEYSLDSIPDIKEVALEEFEGWQNQYVSQIPALNKVPLGKYKNAITNVGTIVMRIDGVWNYDTGLQRTVSGSKEAGGFNVPCAEPDICPHIELDDIEGIGRSIRLSNEGLRWIGGKDPERANICPRDPWGVKGGYGVLGQLNCGQEPTGRLPFGDTFKMVVWETDETTERVDFALFARKCFRSLFVDLGCTPYFIGPFPFLSFEEGDWIFLGSSF